MHVALYRRVISTVSPVYIRSWLLSMVGLFIVIPFFVTDPYTSSLLLTCAGGLLAATVWNDSPGDGVHQIWLSSPISKSHFLVVRTLVALTFATPPGLACGIITRFLFYPDSPLFVVMLTHLVVTYFLVVTGVAIGVMFGHALGAAAIVTCLLVGLMVNPIWQQYARWIVPSLSLFHPGIPDPVNLIGLAADALLLLGTSIWRIGRWESSGTGLTRLVVTLGLLAAVLAAGTEGVDRRYLAHAAFRSEVGPGLVVLHQGLDPGEPVRLVSLATNVRHMLTTQFGVDPPPVTLVVYRSRNLEFADDAGVPSGDHRYKLRYTGQQSTRPDARYNWPSRLTRDMFLDSWGRWQVAPETQRILQIWSEELGDVYATSISGPVDMDAAIISRLSALRRFAQGESISQTLAVQLFLLEVISREGGTILGRAQQSLGSGTPITAEDLYKALREVAKDPQAVDAAWSVLIDAGKPAS